jgi:hypothetical protein
MEHWRPGVTSLEENRVSPGPCPPEFMIRRGVLKDDELLLAHISVCEHCAATYERYLGTYSYPVNPQPTGRVTPAASATKWTGLLVRVAARASLAFSRLG